MPYRFYIFIFFANTFAKIYMQNTYICKIKASISYSILLLLLACLVINNISAVVFVTGMQFISWIRILQNDLI